jgi:hypothetical protein
MDPTLLHAGTGHPDLTLLVLTAILSFAAGTGAGAYAALKGKLSRLTGEPAES